MLPPPKTAPKNTVEIAFFGGGQRSDFGQHRHFAIVLDGISIVGIVRPVHHHPKDLDLVPLQLL